MINTLRLVAALALYIVAQPGMSADYGTVEVAFGKAAQSQKEAAKAIRWTLLERHWRFDKESETTIQATLDRPEDKTWVTVLITFDLTKATISHVDSRAPNPNKHWATPEESTIGKGKYQSWVDNLAKDIPVYLERLQIILS